jgi:hypothetical protein
MNHDDRDLLIPGDHAQRFRYFGMADNPELAGSIDPCVHCGGIRGVQRITETSPKIET